MARAVSGVGLRVDDQATEMMMMMMIATTMNQNIEMSAEDDGGDDVLEGLAEEEAAVETMMEKARTAIAEGAQEVEEGVEVTEDETIARITPSFGRCH